MTPDVSRVLEDLSLFSDLGTDPPRCFQQDGRLKVRMVRNGEDMELSFRNNNGIYEHSLETRQTRNHVSYRALLASEGFGNLRQWQDHQKRALSALKHDFENRIPVSGILSGDGQKLDVDAFDEYLTSRPSHQEGSVKVMLIDGPAGIGKTRFIEFLAWLRAEHYHIRRRPLILHVQSRGRVLTFLQDLIAYSLQSLRLSVTFDQIPVLVRYGLVTLAIDGFDELADPNGYDLAWSQVNDLVDQVRGAGSIILAGRETFIGPERVRNSITALTTHDDLGVLTLQPPPFDVASQWLQRRGATMPEYADDLFEPHSFALRPFFLAQLRQLSSTMKLDPSTGGDLLTALVNAMIEREATKFGRVVDDVLNEGQRRNYVRTLLREVARFVADDQTESIDRTMLSWTVEMAFPEGIDQDVLGILKNRSSTIAFLENDDTPRHLRFSHSKLLNYFLCENIVHAVIDGDLPKYVRRNLFGADFLATFSDFVSHVARTSPDLLCSFFDAALTQGRGYLDIDRGARNLGAMLLTMLPFMERNGKLSIRDIIADEALIRGTTPDAEIHGVTVSQLDIQGSDTSSLVFFDSYIDTLTVDDTTLVSPSIPIPERLQYRKSSATRDRVFVDHRRISDWLESHGRQARNVLLEQGLVPSKYRSHRIVKLLGRACRSRAHWIPVENSAKFDRFIADDLWPIVVSLLEKCNLVKIVIKGARGTNSRFVHIKNASGILSEDAHDERIKLFYESLVRWIRESEGYE